MFISFRLKENMNVHPSKPSSKYRTFHINDNTNKFYLKVTNKMLPPGHKPDYHKNVKKSSPLNFGFSAVSCGRQDILGFFFFHLRSSTFTHTWVLWCWINQIYGIKICLFLYLVLSILPTCFSQIGLLSNAYNYLSYSTCQIFTLPFITSILI